MEEFLIVSAALDLIIYLLGFKYTLDRKITALCALLLASALIGLSNNDISRRFITDFTLPFFFFVKVLVFKKYWSTADFGKYVKVYVNLAFYGSIILLPITYYLFTSSNHSRLAIFPPMELPFANFMLSNTFYVIISFFVILLYGKRAQLVSAIVVFLCYTFVFKRKQIVKFLFIFLVAVVVAFYVFENYSKNLAVSRLKNTFDLFKSEESTNSNIDQISAGRFNEFETILAQMRPEDYFLGKGMGFVYNVDTGGEYIKTSNAHFSPIGFLSKYGLIFTLFVYYFLFSIFLKTNKALLRDRNYVIALGVSVFIFLESFFSYALFVTPILPVALGMMLSLQKKQNMLRTARRNATQSISK
ncbi:O-antigen ligase family protein [Mucilaginibacter flavidus]|uniref:O-antigen ligase family protein n=1 Tax=Mucilaginibacter flavidus TaxID=2949309 RepID=UPI0020933415|nr:O-antigen ligase family protein [Mucilaginibacter flavidus]MCO5949299.1 hypothetical protein [Mucilaginibacter flavidus]